MLAMAGKEVMKGTRIFTRMLSEEQAADATEYALVIALVALGIVSGAIALGGNLANGYTTLSNRVSSTLSGL